MYCIGKTAVCYLVTPEQFKQKIYMVLLPDCSSESGFFLGL